MFWQGDNKTDKPVSGRPPLRPAAPVVAKAGGGQAIVSQEARAIVQLVHPSGASEHLSVARKEPKEVNGSIDRPPKVLTLSGGPHDPGDDLRAYVCLLDDGRLLLSKSQQFTPQVQSFAARIRRVYPNVQVQIVALDMIDDLYNDATSSMVGAKATRMQDASKTLFSRAVKLRASDIHIRVSKRDRTRILFRIHNDLEQVEEHNYEYGMQLCTTLYQAMADVSDATFETLGRQDARISAKEKLPDALDGIRIATTPQVDGMVMVLRLLYNDTSESTDVRELGFTAQQSESILFLRKRPSGIIVIGGPTGSGKSTTLQRTLNSIQLETCGKKNILTVEDPPEYPMPGIVQTPVANASTADERSEAFQDAIKAAMRLDPDVIMIGEVRDHATAKLAVQASMTGHQVWTTVHANSAISILDRLIDLGVDRPLAYDPSIITGLVCQRLVKRLCEHCKQRLMNVIENYAKEEILRVMRAIDLQQTYVRGGGCEHCRKTGVTGRIAVAEIVVTDETFMNMLRTGRRMEAIDYWRRDQNGKTMIESAIEKINAGIVDPFQAEETLGFLSMDKIINDHRISLEEIRDATGQH